MRRVPVGILGLVNGSWGSSLANARRERGCHVRWPERSQLHARWHGRGFQRILRLSCKGGDSAAGKAEGRIALLNGHPTLRATCRTHSQIPWEGRATFYGYPWVSVCL
eukprot:7781273-Pyramimonas_sp.AAC.1